MVYRFQCVLKNRELPEGNEDFLGIDNTSYPLVDRVLDGTVYQLHRDGRRSPVALLQQICYGRYDLMDKLIAFSDGCLSYREVLGPVPPLKERHRYSMSQNGQGFTLYLDFEEENRYGHVIKNLHSGWLEYAHVQYPIYPLQDEEMVTTEMTVYRPDPQAQNGYRPLAHLVRSGNTCDIQMEYVPFPVLCMAICSLPMTASW